MMLFVGIVNVDNKVMLNLLFSDWGAISSRRELFEIIYVSGNPLRSIPETILFRLFMFREIRFAPFPKQFC